MGLGLSEYSLPATCLRPDLLMLARYISYSSHHAGTPRSSYQKEESKSAVGAEYIDGSSYMSSDRSSAVAVRARVQQAVTYSTVPVQQKLMQYVAADQVYRDLFIMIIHSRSRSVRRSRVCRQIFNNFGPPNMKFITS